MAASTTPPPMLSDEEFLAVRATVQDNNPGMAEEIADRIVAEAVKFIAACVTTPGGRLRPSRVVDEGWHALILHTRLYARLCDRLGEFVHHVPERPNPTHHDSDGTSRTQAAISRAGYSVDMSLWLAPTDETIPVAAHCQHSPPGPEGTCVGDGDGPSGPNVSYR